MKITPLSVSSEEFEKIAATISKSYPQSCIMFIEKIEDHIHEEKYQALKLSMTDPDEQHLFHGTTEQAAYAIANDGYKVNLNRRSSYGIGVYFAKEASYSKEYANVSTSGGFELSYMLINKVLTGRKVVGKANSKINLKMADSQVDSVTNPKLFSIPREYQAIPLFLVAFHKNV